MSEIECGSADFLNGEDLDMGGGQQWPSRFEICWVFLIIMSRQVLATVSNRGSTVLL